MNGDSFDDLSRGLARPLSRRRALALAAAAAGAALGLRPRGARANACTDSYGESWCGYSYGTPFCCPPGASCAWNGSNFYCQTRNNGPPTTPATPATPAASPVGVTMIDDEAEAAHRIVYRAK